jgi:hypothetical protein
MPLRLDYLVKPLILGKLRLASVRSSDAIQGNHRPDLKTGCSRKPDAHQELLGYPGSTANLKSVTFREWLLAEGASDSGRFKQAVQQGYGRSRNGLFASEAVPIGQGNMRICKRKVRNY